ncbi:serine/threonine-protein kinase [Streptomyces pseudovenezuelae]|uniref:non-specific serine/threonine protein kinase n=1 Tax=Streptomyces pseudovenezuelae TaxID=67350 RepID=A0ABT6LS77_9ACTN|nr:serine/threonine-protein kinase [Streptomyces pseudovenezuelae]MDH6219167.1 tRNA A-37 threonylcarbamoyl transferase component Bud32 [Streptomyces pseudovenezuelae]
MSSGDSFNGKSQADGTGRLLAGRYRVVAQLGRGGMGVVWRAIDEVLGREVAVKELRTYNDADGPELADLRLRMQREARAAARMRHAGVIAVHDVAEVDGRPLIVMELVDGPSLDDVLRERGTLDAREVAGIGAKVMDALAAAHRAGVLHRDVKPGNILLERSGRVVLTDFGIATMDDPGDGSATHLTRSGELVGSLDYLAPERAQGADPGPASDVWALGATLYAAVEGASPFRRTSTYSTLTAIVSEPLPEPRRAGPLASVLGRLMDKRPEARPDAEHARDLLQAVADTVPTDVQTTTLRESGTPATPPREATEVGLPSVPPGFGPVEPVAGQDAGSAAATESGEQGQVGPVAGQFGPAAAGFGGGEQAGPAAQGFGPPESATPAPGAQTPATGGADVHGLGPAMPGAPDPSDTGTMTPASARRRKGKVLLAAVAVTLVVAAAGTSVALLNNNGDAKKETESGASVDAGGTPASAVTGSPDADRSADDKPTEQGDKESPSASKGAGGKDTDGPTDSGNTPAPGKTSGSGGTTGGGTSGGGGTTGGGSGDGGTTGTGGTTGGDEPTEDPACTSIGGGKYNCTVWQTAKSYTASGTEVGVLGSGTNYFFCQENLGRRETSGKWTNVWWAKTDDDRGNTNVYVSDVYIKGGDNDAPVPGLPVC